MTTASNTSNGNLKPTSNLVFFGYCLFIISFLLHFTARVPALGKLRFDLLLGAGLILVLILGFKNYKASFNHPIVKPIIWLFGYIFLTLPFVEWPGSVLGNNLTVFLKVIVFLFFTIAFVDTEKRLYIVVILYIFCQTVRVLEPLFMNLTQGYWGSATHIGSGEFANRLSGAPTDVVNPNGLGFVICIAFCYWHFLASAHPSKKIKLMYLAVSACLAVALILTMSRTAFIGMLVIAMFIFIKSNKKILLILFGTLILIVGIANMSDLQKDRYLSLTGDTEAVGGDTASGRVAFMGRMYNLWLNKPIFGHGLGTSKEAGANAGQDAKIAHSLYLETLIELGFVGFIIFMIFIKRLYSEIKILAKKTVPKTRKSEPKTYNFEFQLAMTLKACFWMFAIFSIAYFGLSREWWYFMAGVVICLSNLIKYKESQPKVAI